MRLKEMYEKAKDAVFDAAIRGINFAKANPDICAMFITGGTTLIGIGTRIGRNISRNRKMKKERYLKERYIYDRSLGMYLKTRRPLRNNDYVIINHRRQNGERLSDILSSMNLLD